MEKGQETASHNHHNDIEEDEIDLVELIQIIQKRKIMIFITVALAAVIAVLYIFIQQPLYKAVLILKNGEQIYKTPHGKYEINYFIGLKTLENLIDPKFNVGKFKIYRKPKEKAYVDSIKIPRNQQSQIEVSILALNNAYAVKKAKEVYHYIYNLENENYQNIIKTKKYHIRNLQNILQNDEYVSLPILNTQLKQEETLDLNKIDEEINFLKYTSLNTINKKINKYENEQSIFVKNLKRAQKELNKAGNNNPSFKSIILLNIRNNQSMIVNLYNLILNLEKEKESIIKIQIPALERQKEKLLKVTIANTKAKIKKLTKITIPSVKTKIALIKDSMKPFSLAKPQIIAIKTLNHPVKPRKLLIIAIALVSGLFIGLFLAFLLEWRSKLKTK